MNKLIEIIGLKKYFYIKASTLSKKRVVKAVEDANFHVNRGEVFGLIGESGSGKTTISNMIMGLYTPTEGAIFYKSRSLTDWLKKEEVSYYRKDVQIVFQQSKEVLDPKQTLEKLLKKPLQLHGIVPKDKLDEEVDRLMTIVGLNPKDKVKKPTAFSGGQLQRICIARALSLRPSLIILDEPVSALDVSVQGQIINLLMQLKEEQGLTYILISHDLNVVKHMCDRIAVMKNGEIVEVEVAEKIFNSPQANYTKKLISDTML